MINKFHKTTYSRQHNFNAVSSSHGRRNPLIQPPHPDWMLNQKIQLPVQRKIDIESSLFITHKNYPPTAATKPAQVASRKPVNKSQAKFYQTAIGFSQARDRPQSKQEPRVKGLNQAKIKTQIFQPDRPRTSKGVRKIRGNISEICQRQISENDEQVPIQIKVTQKKTRNVQSSYARRPQGSQPNQSSLLPFQTSIDPQFLALFAN